jgi:uncharacterized protein
MIVQFEYSNYRSFKNQQTFSMLASATKLKKRELVSNLISIDKNNNLLKSAVVYGANASGKSNFISAINMFSQIILQSNNIVENSYIQSLPFLYDKESRYGHTKIEITIWVNGLYYQYGFIYSKEAIVEEWLYVKETRVSKVFHRVGQNFDQIGNSYKILKDDKFQKTIHTKSLLLSRGASFNEEICTLVYSNILKLVIISGIHDSIYQDFTIQRLKNQGDKSIILNLLRNADLGIEDIEVKEVEGVTYNIQLKDNSFVQNKAFLKTVNTIRSLDDGTKLETELMTYESEGTKKFFHLTGPILNTLENGNVLIIDELDTKLHPLLTRKIVELFHNPKTNPKNAQLIFTTHDTNLLDRELFRRDQIWFTEKDKNHSSQLYSLSDFKIRNDMDLEKNYIEGKYGAIPYLINSSSLLGDD